MAQRNGKSDPTLVLGKGPDGRGRRACGKVRALAIGVAPHGHGEASAEQRAKYPEALCTRCGKCCYEKLDINGRIYVTPVPCRFLDTATNLCTVYAERHQLEPTCLPITDETIARGVLPADCPYVAHVPNYRPPTGINVKADWDLLFRLLETD